MEDKEKNIIRANIERCMSSNGYNAFQLYVDESGWEDWMKEYCKDEDNLLESEIRKITEKQREMWDIVYKINRLTEIREEYFDIVGYEKDFNEQINIHIMELDERF